MNDFKIRYLEFIQKVITRMNTNSFLIKGWMITLVSALFALAAKDADIRYVIVIYISVIAFWLLDAFYLSQERQYRDLYKHALSQDEVDFSMDASGYNTGKNTWLSTLISKTLLVLYPPIILIIFLIIFYFN